MLKNTPLNFLAKCAFKIIIFITMQCIPINIKGFQLNGKKGFKGTLASIIPRYNFNLCFKNTVFRLKKQSSRFMWLIVYYTILLYCCPVEILIFNLHFVFKFFQRKLSRIKEEKVMKVKRGSSFPPSFSPRIWWRNNFLSLDKHIISLIPHSLPIYFYAPSVQLKEYFNIWLAGTATTHINKHHSTHPPPPSPNLPSSALQKKTYFIFFCLNDLLHRSSTSYHTLPLLPRLRSLFLGITTPAMGTTQSTHYSSRDICLRFLSLFPLCWLNSNTLVLLYFTFSLSHST